MDLDELTYTPSFQNLIEIDLVKIDLCNPSFVAKPSGAIAEWDLRNLI